MWLGGNGNRAQAPYKIRGMRLPPTRWRLIALAVGVAVGVAFPVLGLNSTGQSLTYTSCRDVGVVSNQSYVWVPVQLINSPYAGRASGSVQLQDGPEIGTGLIYNGSVAWSGVEVNLTVDSFSNITSRGLSPSTPCTLQFQVSLARLRSSAVGIQLVGQGNKSDALEPNWLLDDNSPNVTFQNGFSTANEPTFTTCGDSGNATISALSPTLTLTYSFWTGGQHYSLPFLAPGTNASFHYWFPANFGSWAQDDLSAVGGSGGGLAFDYLGPCG